MRKLSPPIRLTICKLDHSDLVVCGNQVEYGNRPQEQDAPFITKSNRGSKTAGQQVSKCVVRTGGGGERNYDFHTARRGGRIPGRGRASKTEKFLAGHHLLQPGLHSMPRALMHSLVQSSPTLAFSPSRPPRIWDGRIHGPPPTPLSLPTPVCSPLGGGWRRKPEETLECCSDTRSRCGAPDKPATAQGEEAAQSQCWGVLAEGGRPIGDSPSVGSHVHPQPLFPRSGSHWRQPWICFAPDGKVEPGSKHSGRKWRVKKGRGKSSATSGGFPSPPPPPRPQSSEDLTGAQSRQPAEKGGEVGASFAAASQAE